MTRAWILGLNPFVRGLAIMAISFGFARMRAISTGNLEGAISSFFWLTALIYEVLIIEFEKMPQALLVFFCRGVVLAAGGVTVALFFFKSGVDLYDVFGVAAMILAYELAILPRREKIK